MIWNINPTLIDLGPLEIRYYGVFFALGLFGAYSLARYMCKKKGLSLELLDSLSVYLIIGLIVGARLGHILFYNLDYYLNNPLEILAVWHGGLASHGATIGLLLALAIWLLKNKKVKFFEYADIIVIAGCIPIALIRLGNFFNSELYGRPTSLPWGVKFTNIDDITRHPSQIYEFLMGFLIFAILYPLWLKKFNTAKSGLFFGLFFVLYFSFRFTVEFFKEFPLHENFFNLTTGQILSLPFIIFGAIILSRKKI